MSSDEVRAYFDGLQRILYSIILPTLESSETEVLSRRLEDHKYIISSFIVCLSSNQAYNNSTTDDLTLLLEQLSAEIDFVLQSIFENHREASSRWPAFHLRVVHTGDLGRPRYVLYSNSILSI